MNDHVASPSPLSAESPYRHGGLAPLTLDDSPPTPAVESVELNSMRLLARDQQVLTWVDRFGQLTTSQIRALVFFENRSATPCEVALKRLVKAELLEHVAQRHPGGRLGGSAVNVFQLGREGWRLFYEGRRKFSRVIKAHSLSMADAFIAAKTAEREGWLDIFSYAIESDAWLNVAGADIRPDLFLELGLPETQEGRVLWIEVDLGSEREKQIVDKLERYTFAYRNAADLPLESFPSVLFLAPDAERVQDIRQYVKRFERRQSVPDGLFSVALQAEFPALLRG